MKLLKKEWLFFIFLALFIVLYIYQKPDAKELIASVDFPTIRALTLLLLITTAIKISNFFEYVSIKLLSRFKTERALGFSFVLLSFFLSMFLTNDVTLFILVPLTIAFSKKLKNDITKLVIFEAIAVNAGSALTPFGNPQNLFLFRQMHISQLEFVCEMAKIVIPQALLLTAFTFFSFKTKKLEITSFSKIKTDKLLFLSSLVLFLAFIIALELSLVKYVLIVAAAFYLVFYRRVLLEFDYFLIFTFVLMFMDFSLISKLDFIRNIMKNFDFSFLNTFNLTAALSQIISNVPASIFISNFTDKYLAIAYGANIAGNGFVIASLANIIALRFLNDFRAYILFHKYSVIFFILAYLLVIYII
ncbi:MAG: anion transporter [Epsilonproteobacteria bacterium]|nr:anion transporter [Campylobacterota bacterium]